MSTPTVKKMSKFGRRSSPGSSRFQSPPSPFSQSRIWPEWSDTEVNAEKWGSARILPDTKGKGKTSAKSARSAKTDRSAKTRKSGKSEKISETTSPKLDIEEFEDPYEIPLPWSLKTNQCTWKRPDVIFPNTSLVVFSQSSPLMPDLVSLNRTLFKSSFIRSVVSAVHMLMYIGNTRPFTIEWTTSQFQPNTEGQPWKPWHHIYSLCHAGKGQAHNPQSNTMGKYVVRLYWLGCWRKFIVDDTFPVDESGKLLLPVSNINNDKEVELWPALLTKALLKIASLTWTDKQEIVDFDVVTCLTGWAVQKIFTRGMDMQDIWEVFCGYSDHYTWEPRLILGPPVEEPVLLGESRRGTATTKSQSKKSSKKDKSSKSSTSSKGQKGKVGKGADVALIRSFHLVASCADLRSLDENLIEDISPCYEHDFLIEDTRNIPLIDKIPEYDRHISKWKEFRWIDWAVEHGLWDRVEDWEIYKCMRVVSSMRKTNDNAIFPEETTVAEQYIKHSALIIDEFVERKKHEKLEGGNKDKGRKKDKEKKPKPKKEKASSKGSSKGSSKKAKQEFINPSIWCNFVKIAPYITCISVYLKPSSFKIKYVISDIQFSAASDYKSKKPFKKENKKDQSQDLDESSIRYLYWENVLMKSRNEAIYLFTDSIDFKLTMFSLSHLGNKLPEPVEKQQAQEKKPECKKLVCKRNKCDNGCICQKIASEELRAEKPFVDTRQSAHFIVEEFNWKNLSIGEMPISIKTYGNKSALMDFEKGRHVKRIWFDANSPYVLLIFCDTEIAVGKIEEILDAMQEESELLTESCYSICSSFGKLIQFFGFPEYKTALKSFYKSYMPTVYLSKKQMALIHEGFQEELINVLTTLLPSANHYDVSRAFRILLLNPNFRIPYRLCFVKKDSNIMFECLECPCDDIDRMKLVEISAIKIQSFFKMIYMRKLKSLHDPYDKKFTPVVDTLKQVYLSIFASKVRPVNIDLLRSLAINKNLKSVIRYFPFYKDLSSVIFLKQITGEVKSFPEYSWVPLFRKRFYSDSSDAIFIRVYVFCLLPVYILRIFNNDTGTEIERHTNNALVRKYEKNEKGYTILGYGWTDKIPLKSMEWTLYLVIDKILNLCPIVLDNNKNITTSIRGNYVPNKDNLICKFTVKVQESCLGTFHLQSSYQGAVIKIQCLGKYGDIIFETTGTSHVLIPIVNLLKIEEEQRTSLNDSKLDFSSLKSSSDSTGLIYSKSETKYKASYKIQKSKSSFKKRSTRSIERRSASPSPSKRKIKFNFFQEKEPDTVYILQAFVIENTWPLTLQEWYLTEKLRHRTSIEHELNLNQDSLLQEQETIHKSVTETRKSHGSHRKLKDRSSMFLKSKNEKPYWILTCFGDVENFCNVQVDESRLEEIKNVKRNIFMGDTTRYTHGQELRKEFLESNYIKWLPEISPEIKKSKDFSSQFNTFSEDLSKSMSIKDSSRVTLKSKSLSLSGSIGEKLSICPECNKPRASEECLFLKSPESFHRMLAPFEVNKYDLKNDKFRWLVTPQDEKRIFKDIIEKVNIFDEEHNKYVTEMDDYLQKNKKRHEFFLKWYEEIRQDSFEMMREAETRRQNFIKKIRETADGGKR